MKKIPWRKLWIAQTKKWHGLTRTRDLPTPVVLWRGLSRLDGVTEVLAAACATQVAPSRNSKTGDMIQVAIFRADLPPAAAWRQGQDGAVCPASCVHRSSARGGQNSCYVNKGRLRSAWGAAVQRKVVPRERLASWAKGARLRFGMEGDPSAVPLYVWEELARTAGGWAGYTAHWRQLDAAWERLFMASCSSPEEAAQAEALGWRTFSSSDSPRDDRAHLAAGRKLCHAESFGLTCNQCGGCSGLAKGSRRPSFFLPLHGPVGAAVRRRADQPPLLFPPRSTLNV